MLMEADKLKDGQVCNDQKKNKYKKNTSHVAGGKHGGGEWKKMRGER